MRSSVMPGKLYVCPTPIGNLEDITLRVKRVLGEVDIIAAEDTRVTKKLLAFYDISKPLVSYREHGEERRIEGILAELSAGRSVALVSDAGTPGLSDPGHKLIRTALDRNYPVEVLPGPSAAITALVASGLPTDSFIFEGFLPRKAGERRKLLEELLASGRTIILYEAPHRIERLLAELDELARDRRVALARELTKKFEEILKGTPSAIKSEIERRAKGEMVVVIDRGGKPAGAGEISPDELAQEVRAFVEGGMDKKTAIGEVAKERGIAKRVVYDAARGISAKA